MVKHKCCRSHAIKLRHQLNALGCFDNHQGSFQLQPVIKPLVHYECFRERLFVSASTKEADNHTQGTHLML